MNKIAKLSFVLAAFQIQSSVRAAVVIENLGNGTAGTATTISGGNGQVFGIPLGQADIAFSFTTNGVGGILSDLVIKMGTDGIDNNSAIVATLSTGSAVAGGVNPLTLATVTPDVNPFLGQLVSFTPTTTVTLAPNTQYWVGLSIPAATTSTYTMRSTNAVNEAPGWTLGSTYFRNGGSTSNWIELGPDGNNQHAKASISLIVVPEPTSAALGGLALLFLLQRRYR